MNRSLLTPRWLLVHVLFAAAVVTTGLLAWWQWDRAHETTGTFQNLGYALQWPLFGIFAIFLWYRLVSAEHQRPADDEVAEAQNQEAVRQRERRRPLVPPPAPPVSDDEDPELAAYNKYLAELNRLDL